MAGQLSALSRSTSRTDYEVRSRQSAPPPSAVNLILRRASEAVPRVLPIKTAVVSVSDKSGLGDIANALQEYGVEIIATEGTTKHLRDTAKGELNLVDLTAYTQFPENLNGRLKTLHPKIQAGVLGIRGHHEKKLQDVAAKFIDLVIVNLYPFEKAINENKSYYECIEFIDIGGPALLRAAAKNHACVAALCDPSQYGELLDEIRTHEGHTTLEFRKRCAKRAFELTSKYDRLIADWFASAGV